ncbi:Saccharopine dehydrogenase-domain-containing protein [Apiosordaria backusii]|uniref:Saccharopine dehydrogenase-domain-containing protein n=1 Tax=Apiosordaria backusii TaxID=314023 RepID=A0AA40EC54_9PEZI|nr:Saccharopine dehydrogenase-domain-containing protein [Apiosordaria backusii]
MAFKDHGRQYDLVVFGATGYTGKLTAKYITTHLPSTLKWAIAGRSQDKLELLIEELKKLNPDRSPPSIETCSLNDADLSSLTKKTFILITTVGPYSAHGEHAFKACAQNGTHYLDVTGEVPYVAAMIKKYESTAQSTGALMFPQIGIESAPPDLLTFALATTLREELNAKTADVIISIHNLKSAPSGGTLATALTISDYFPLPTLIASYKPYALSPVPNPTRTPKVGLLTRLTGLITVPHLGLLTSSIASGTDTALIHRTWGLLSTLPSRKDQSYGPRFTFREYMKPRNWLTGIAIHFGIILFGLIIVTGPLRRFLARRVTQPGEGPEEEVAKQDEIEYRGVASPDGEEYGKKKAVGRAWFRGSTYYLTGIFLAEAARTILEESDELGLGGGVYTPALLGRVFMDNLEKGGFHIETQILEE